MNLGTASGWHGGIFSFDLLLVYLSINTLHLGMFFLQYTGCASMLV